MVGRSQDLKLGKIGHKQELYLPILKKRGGEPLKGAPRAPISGEH